MKIWLKWFVGVSATLAVLAISAYLFVYLQIIRPIKYHAELCLGSPLDGKVDPADLREAAHKSLRWVVDHDSFLTLEAFGDETSIPVLIRSLKRVDKPGPDGIVVCTSDHCLSALQKITREEFGYDVDAWERWWKNKNIQRGAESNR